MDVELRLLLYVVVLGCVVGVATLVARRAAAYHAYAFQLVAIAAAACAGFVRDDLGAVLAWPLFAAWALVAVVPVLLVSSGRRAAARRRYGLASSLVSFAAGLLLLPRPLRREARLFAALEAAESGDEAGCVRRLESIGDLETGGPSSDTRDLVAIVPAAAARRWPDVLRAAAASERRGPFVLSAEITGSAETGDVRRALRAAGELVRYAPDGSPALAHARRAILAAAGRTAFLEVAVRERLPVAEGPPGAVSFALGRAYEATGDAEAATLAYRAAAADARGALRRDAEAGANRCAKGELRRTSPDELELAAVHELERACSDERPDPSRRPLLERAPATVAICAITAVASILAFALLGTDVLSLVAAGALSAPLVVGEGEWWRLASAMLLHGGAVHLLLNIASIAVIAVPYEQRSGSVRTAIVYVASGLFASAASVYLNGTDVGVGASGAAMGIFGALCVLLVARPRMFDPAERRQWFASCAVVLLANAAIGVAESEAIDNAAHAGGFVAGAVLAWVLLPAPLESALHGGVRRLVAAILLTVVAVSAGAVLRDAPGWFRTERRVVAGVDVALPAWLHGAGPSTLGVVAQRPPLPFAAQTGVHGAAWPDVHVLAAMAAGCGAAEVRSWPVTVTEAPGDDGLLRREHRWPRRADGDAPGPATDMRAVVLSRRGAFAAFAFADDPREGRAFAAFVEEAARTLVPAPAETPR